MNADQREHTSTVPLCTHSMLIRSAVLAGLAGSALCLTLDGAIGVAQVLEPYLNPDPETAPPAVRPHSVAVLWNWSGMRCIRVCVCVCVFTRMQTIA